MPGRVHADRTHPTPHPGTGPTIIAAALIVLVIGLGWLNNGNQPAQGNFITPVAGGSGAEAATAASAAIPAAEAATPEALEDGRSASRRSARSRLGLGSFLTVAVELPVTTGAVSARLLEAATGLDVDGTPGTATVGGSGAVTTVPRPTTTRAASTSTTVSRPSTTVATTTTVTATTTTAPAPTTTVTTPPTTETPTTSDPTGTTAPVGGTGGTGVTDQTTGLLGDVLGVLA
jgi:hypothetical protein